MTKGATETGLPVDVGAAEALRLARRAHRGQVRKQDGRPFVEHVSAVAEMLARLGWSEEVVTAAYLHDAIEKTDVDPEEIEHRLGARVRALVEAMSEDPGIDSYAERKRALRSRVREAGPEAIAIYAADRLANVGDMVALSEPEREAASRRLGTSFAERVELWQEDLEMLAAAEPEPPFLADLAGVLRAAGADVPAPMTPR